MISQLAFIIVPHEYDTALGRRIHKMKQEALAKAATPLIDYLLETHRDLGDGEGIESFECYVTADPECRDKALDLYEMACQLEDLGTDFCANYVGLKLTRKDPTNIVIQFTKRTDPAPQVSHFNKD